MISEDDQDNIIYNRSLLALARYYGFHPKACRPYRAKTKGKVERPFSYIRQDFFLARTSRNLDDLNAQLRDWLDTVANVRLHGTTQKIVSEVFAAESQELQDCRPSASMPCSSSSAGSAITGSSRSAATTAACPIARDGSWRSISCPTSYAFSTRGGS